MKQQNESVKKLEVGKDYINLIDNDFIIIERKNDGDNVGFIGKDFKSELLCRVPKHWREATEEEVIEAFKRHLIHRYGEDWETMKIKENLPNQNMKINDGLWIMEIDKDDCGWVVWNKNGLIYQYGVWVERLENESSDSTTVPESIDETKIKIKPSETQIGGNHYSNMAIQPTEFIHKNNLSFIQGNIIKYICRYKSKGGIQDLNKAKHYIDLLIEFEGDK